MDKIKKKKEGKFEEKGMKKRGKVLESSSEGSARIVTIIIYIK